MSTTMSDPVSNNVSLCTAYTLWLLGGAWGLHHVYLGRSHQAFIWFGTFSFFGLGWIRDGFLLPYYVSLARSDPDDPVVKIQKATRDARGGVPPLSLLRIGVMTIFSAYLGMVVSCIFVLPKGWETETSVIEAVLYAVGTAIGVICVGNIGEETLDFKTHSLFLSLFIGRIWNYPVLSPVIYATWSRKYRSSVVPQGKATRRFGRHLFSCGAWVLILTLATYNHGYVNVNGRKIFASEAFHNARKSDFFKEFHFEDFRRHQGRSSRSDYLKQTLDLEGDRAACRTLGVSVDANYTEIKTSYKALARQYHPDKVSPNASEKEQQHANEQFLKIQEAYEVLTRIEQRKKTPPAQRAKDTPRKSRQQQKDEF